MREDMYRVVTERPRRGSAMRNRKTRLTIKDPENERECSQPLRSSMTRRNRINSYGTDGYKDFTDRIGPLLRYLHSKVGQPWNGVYSEIRKAIPANSKPPIQHIWDQHIKGEVALNCVLGTDGKVYDSTYHKGRYGLAADIRGLYVHPVTKTLEYIPETPWRKKESAPPNPDLKLLRKSWEGCHDDETHEVFSSTDLIYKLKSDPLRKVARLKGIWYVMEYRDHDPNQKVNVGTNSFGFAIYDLRKNRKDLPTRYFVKKRQMNTKELRRMGLRNLPAGRQARTVT